MLDKRYERGEQMKKIKEYVRQRAVLVGLLLFFIAFPLVLTFSRYISNQLDNYYLSSRDFYFQSNRLAKDHPTYQITNWSGVDVMSLDITMMSSKNDLLYTDYDIAYDIEIVCPEDVTCSLSKQSGVIYEASHQDQFTVTVVPQRVFETDEKVSVEVIATSTIPYQEEISATFEFVVSTMEVSYSIDDTKNQPYLTLALTNSITYYKVYEPFGMYQIGDELDETTYLSLPLEDQAKCASAMITLNFDPNEVVIDTTSSIIQESTYTTTMIHGIAYINSLTFPMSASSSKDIRFYKIDASKDYTYPLENQDSVVKVNVQ